MWGPSDRTPVGNHCLIVIYNLVFLIMKLVILEEAPLPHTIELAECKRDYLKDRSLCRPFTAGRSVLLICAPPIYIFLPEFCSTCQGRSKTRPVDGSEVVEYA